MIIEGPLGRAHRRPSVHARHTAADRREETCKAKSATVGGRYHENMHARLLFLQIVSRTLNYSITIMRGAFCELLFLMQTRSLMLTRILIHKKHAKRTPFLFLCFFVGFFLEFSMAGCPPAPYPFMAVRPKIKGFLATFVVWDSPVGLSTFTIRDGQIVRPRW